MNRRGQGLSVNLIILVAIGLLILIIAIVLVNRSGRGLSTNASNDCVTKGGYCTTDFQCPDGEKQLDQNLGTSYCEDTKGGNPQICCRYAFGEATTP